MRNIDPEKERKAQAVIDTLLFSPISEWEKIKKVVNGEASIVTVSPVRQSIEQNIELRGREYTAYYEDAIRKGLMSAREAYEALNAVLNEDVNSYMTDIMADIPSYVIEIHK